MAIRATDLLPLASRAMGERLPCVGSRWRAAGELLDQLAAHVPARAGLASLEARAGGDLESHTLMTADGLRLAAWYLPSGPRAAVVVHHHFGGTRHDALPVARFLRAAGHPVLLFDARSHGESDTGASLGLALADRPADVAAAVGFLRARGHREFHGLGFSMGAAVLMMGASRSPGLRSLVLDSGPVVHLYSACQGIIGQRLRRAPGPLRRLAAQRLYLDGLGWRYRADLEAAARRIPSVPVLLIHGERDTVIPLSETETMRLRLLRGPCERIVLPGTAHVVGWARHRVTYRNQVLDFLRGAEEAAQRAAGGR